MTDQLGAIELEATPILFGCSCPACMAQDKFAPNDAVAPGGEGVVDASGPGLFQMLDITQAADGTWFYSGDRDIDSALIGSRWTVTNITYSFPTSGEAYGENYDTGQANFQIEFNAAQQAAAQASFALVSSYTNLTFTEITEDADTHAILRLSQTGSAGTASASGYFPGPDFRSGDIWFGRTSQPYYDTPERGNWGFATIMHEIGHTLGLKHGHQDYTFSDLSQYFGGGGPRFGSRSTPTEHDGQAWTLMSYRSDPGQLGATVFSGDAYNQPQSYMQNDIAALQYLYGANFNTNAGDSVYTWSETTGEMFINGAGQGVGASAIIFQTIWDGNGVDTYDVSNYDDGVSVDLRPGAFSMFSHDQLANHRAYTSGMALAPGNVANALLFEGDTRSLIENAIGGDGADSLIGNQINNALTGGQGDDVLEGGAGDDLMDGGAGSDTAVFYSNTGGITVTLNDGTGDILVINGANIDTLRSIENVVGGEGNDFLTGDTQANLLDGGALGHDTLIGNDGDDTLIASGYVRTASDMADFAKPQAQDIGSQALAWVLSADDFDTALDGDITSSTTLPHATINAVATGGALEYYRIDVQAGDQVVFDIDTTATTTLDSWIELVNAGGTVIANNDTGSSGDAGGYGNDDAFLAHTFAAAGTYYLRVGQWTVANPPSALPLTAGQTYTLNISWTGGDESTFTLDETGSGTLLGGAGDDLLVAGAGDDEIAGGADADTLSYQAMFDGVNVDLTLQGAAQDTGTAGMDTITGVENLTGSGFDDDLTGDGNANVINGGGGNDVMDGAGGVDTLSYDGATAGVTVSLGDGSAQATGGSGTDTVTGFEHLTGSAFNDALTGDANANVVSGEDGDDILNGGGQSGVRDTLNGGAGNDVASFAGAAYAAGVFVTLNDGGDVVATDLGATEFALLQSIEGIEGSSGDDFIIADTLDNVLRGLGGADFIDGFTGNDTIEGGDGNDIIEGGADIDTLVFTGATAITLDLSNTLAQATGYGADTISGIENVVTGSGADNVTGSIDANVFFDNGGNDTYNGGLGSDTIDYSSRTSAVSVNLGNAAAQATGGGGTETISNVENLVGTAFNDVLRGNVDANTFTGGLGNDSAIGAAGADILSGGDGGDILAGDSDAAVAGGDGNDTIDGGAGNDVIIAGLGNDLVDAGIGNDVIIAGLGTAAFNAGVATATATLNAASGADTIDGGDGIDLVYMNYAAVTGDLHVDISDPIGTNDVTLNGVLDSQLVDVERLIMRGGQGNDTMVGGISADQFLGNEGNDSLDGGVGNDSLWGSLNDDVLIGGEGLDTLSYALATGGVALDLRVTTAQNTGLAEGVDTVSGIEHLIGGIGSDTFDGSDVFNTITDATGGSDTIRAHGGNDTVAVTRSGTMVSTANVIEGGGGNDTLSIASTARTVGTPQTDTVTISGGNGNDIISATGTGLASSVIDGGIGNDAITVGLGGAAGTQNHTITGGAGTDAITLGNNGVTSAYSTARNGSVTDLQAKAGGDRFEWTNFLNAGGGLIGYTASTNAFASGHLQLVQSGVDLVLQIDRDGAGIANGFVNLFTLEDGASKGFTAFNFDGMTVNALGLTGTDGAETLAGSDNNDTISSGWGQDLVEGGAGNDTMDGGGGVDRVTYQYAGAAVTVDLTNLGSQDTGGWGSDQLAGIEQVTGTGFNDVLTGDARFNVLEGLAGDDQLNGGVGADRLFGGDGNDTLSAGADDDRVDGGDGSDTITYAGVAAAVTVDLLAGTATGDGSDTLIRVEHVIGGDGADVITGSNRANVLSGGSGADQLSGQNGADVLQGGIGADTLTGGRGADVLTGGADADVFMFDDLDTQTDTITDLQATDVVDLSLIDANLNKPGNPGFTVVGAFSGVRGEATLTYHVVDDVTTLAMDRNGDGVADLEIDMNGNQTIHTNWVGLTI